jgi:hypothetical protein
MRHVVFPLAFAAACACVAPAPAGAADLDAGSIRSELVDRAIRWTEAAGWRRGSLTLRADGTAAITVDAPERHADEGRWTLEGDRICTVWPDLRGAAPKCYAVRRDADGGFATTGGNLFRILDAGV